MTGLLGCVRTEEKIGKFILVAIVALEFVRIQVLVVIIFRVTV